MDAAFLDMSPPLPIRDAVQTAIVVMSLLGMAASTQLTVADALPRSPRLVLWTPHCHVSASEPVDIYVLFVGSDVNSVLNPFIDAAYPNSVRIELLNADRVPVATVLDRWGDWSSPPPRDAWVPVARQGIVGCRVRLPRIGAKAADPRLRSPFPVEKDRVYYLQATYLVRGAGGSLYDGDQVNNRRWEALLRHSETEIRHVSEPLRIAIVDAAVPPDTRPGDVSATPEESDQSAVEIPWRPVVESPSLIARLAPWERQAGPDRMLSALAFVTNESDHPLLLNDPYSQYGTTTLFPVFDRKGQWVGGVSPFVNRSIDAGAPQEHWPARQMRAPPGGVVGVSLRIQPNRIRSPTLSGMAPPWDHADDARTRLSSGDYFLQVIYGKSFVDADAADSPSSTAEPNQLQNGLWSTAGPVRPVEAFRSNVLKFPVP